MPRVSEACRSERSEESLLRSTSNPGEIPRRRLLGMTNVKYRPRSSRTSHCDKPPTSSATLAESSRPGPTKMARPDRPPGPRLQTWSRKLFAACHYCNLNNDAENISALEEQHREASLRLSQRELLSWQGAISAESFLNTWSSFANGHCQNPGHLRSGGKSAPRRASRASHGRTTEAHQRK